MRITVRRGTEADARAVADLWLRSRKAAVGTIPGPVHDDDDVRAWFASHVVCDAELWVAEDRAGTLVGMLVLQGRLLDQLYVEPTMTARGIGARLVEVAKRERPDGLEPWTYASNAGAQRFYERHGFVQTRRTDGRHNEEGPTGHPLRLARRELTSRRRGADAVESAWPPTRGGRERAVGRRTCSADRGPRVAAGIAALQPHDRRWFCPQDTPRWRGRRVSALAVVSKAHQVGRGHRIAHAAAAWPRAS